MDKFISCFLDESIHREFKLKVTSKGLTQKEVVSILIQKYVKGD